MSELDEIRGRLEAATPGPWMVRSDHAVAQVAHSTGEQKTTVTYGPTYRSDAEFIAHTPVDIARLLAAVEAGMDTLDERARQLRETANRLDQQVMDGDKDRHPSDADRYNQYAAAAEAAAWHLRMTITTALEAKP